LGAQFESFHSLRQHAHMGMGCVKGHVQSFSTIDISVHHHIAQLTHSQPIISAIDQPEPFSSVQISPHCAYALLHGSEPCRQQLIPQQILSTAETSHKSVNPLRKINVFQVDHQAFRAEGSAKKPLISLLQMAQFSLCCFQQARQALTLAWGEFVFQAL
jgi:hypothetical protein